MHPAELCVDGQCDDMLHDHRQQDTLRSQCLFVANPSLRSRFGAQNHSVGHNAGNATGHLPDHVQKVKDPAICSRFHIGTVSLSVFTLSTPTTPRPHRPSSPSHCFGITIPSERGVDRLRCDCFPSLSMRGHCRRLCGLVLFLCSVLLRGERGWCAERDEEFAGLQDGGMGGETMWCDGRWWRIFYRIIWRSNFHALYMLYLCRPFDCAIVSTSMLIFCNFLSAV